MQVLLWILAGLFAGWLARLGARQRSFGLAGDLVLGLLGGSFGGFALRRLGVTVPDDAVKHVLVAFVGAVVLIAVSRVARRTLQRSLLFFVAPSGLTPEDLRARLRAVGEVNPRVLARLVEHPFASRDVSAALDQELTFGQRLADSVAAFGGSWTFIGIFFSMMSVWIIVNLEIAKPFDPYPFILLNLALSCLAAMQAPIIMMSQNRQAAHDRRDAKNDYEVNLRAEIQIDRLHARLDELRDRELDELLKEIKRLREAVAAGGGEPRP
jgi:uncharacterized membrane protein/uncharacterized membrane protein YeaQ/YmgE (transglycosylase-associated protein family)